MESSSYQERQANRSCPEPGQLVEVRRRRWIVSDIAASNLHSLPRASWIGDAGPAYIVNDAVEVTPRRQHLVRLSSIDEDGLGEELEVIWEIEPGAHIIERAGLPTITGHDDSRTLDAFLDAVRWGAATNADRGFLQAPFRSGVSIEDFQLDPLVRAIDMARVNLLIADDVGLGKTIEAGLVIQEMLLRHRARTILIICPASLQEKWRVEMLEKFGLEFRVVDTAYIKQLRRERGIHANPWASHPRLITSMDWIKGGEGLRTMRDVLPVTSSYPRKFDLLVVDEAHNIAPAAGAQYAVESQRTRVIRLLSPHFQHRLFLTATPHNGYTESFTSLLELLDDQRFARTILPDEKQLGQVMIRRLKSELVGPGGELLFAQRVLKALEVRYTPKEREIHQKLNAYCFEREKDAAETGTTRGIVFISRILKKRFFSSPAAFASTLERHSESLAMGGRPKTPAAMDERILRKAILKIDEDYADDQEVESAQLEAVDAVSRQAPPLTPAQGRILDELRQWAQQAKNQVDSKAQAILEWLSVSLKPNGEWNDRRVILFTEYRTTQTWMHAILATHGFGGDRLSILHGGLSQDEREPIKAAFQAAPKDSPVRILLATDAASEGIDLQNHCNYLIHLEIPYNPNVMEQRNGRIDRHGQREKEVLIWHPVDSGSHSDSTVGGHGEDILRALDKLESMRADMGSVNPVIAPQMPELIEGSRKQLDTGMATAKAAAARRLIRTERDLKERIARLHERLLATQQDFHLTPEHIEASVRAGLALAGRPPLEPVALAGAPAGRVFKMPMLAGSWSRCMEGLRHPHTQQLRPVTFDHAVAKGRDDVVLVHLNHRLVQMCLRLLRAEVWAGDDVKKLHRVTVRAMPDGSIDGSAVVIVSRLVITGGHHHRLHEELTFSGGYLRDQSFRREDSITRIQNWLDQARPSGVSESLLDALRLRFDRSQAAIMQSVDVRSKERLKFLTNTLQTRKQQEIKDIGAVLDELEKSIRSELDKDEQPEQLSLFSEAERTQLKRNTDALKARLSRVPAERMLEVEAIEARYAKLEDRTFPVAVIFIVPDSAAR